ncbi:MAG: L,D-transpeptidase [Lachnospiraceae bacterium]|nr:L,D-transpeptidase [Lachnospiraceae bacterium]
MSKPLFRSLFVISGCMLLYLCPFESRAATPSPLSRTSLEATSEKCADATAFQVTYTFGDQIVPINTDSCPNWFVTSSSLERMQKEVRGEGRERSGYFLIDGKESAFPSRYRIENGFVTDMSGNLIISESEMYETLKRLFDQYNTRVDEGTTVFYATSGRTVFFGGEPEPVSKVDLDEEFDILVEACIEGDMKAERVIYTEKVNSDVRTVGDSYVEVDMADQMLYFYLDGELIVETPVVTGNMAWGMGTPEGIWPIFNITRNAVLVGENYRTPVNYWMAFTHQGHGIHDSTWRTSGYGGDIYLTDGSHGCVNTPLDKVSIVFENAYLGLPVVTFY